MGNNATACSSGAKRPGVSLSVLTRLAAEAKERQGKMGPIRTWRLHEQPPSRRAAGEPLTTEDVAFEIVRRVAQDAPSGRYVDSEAVFPKERRGATVHVIHAWSCDFASLVAALSDCDSAGSDYFWLDVLAETLSAEEPTPRPVDFWTERLGEDIAATGRAVVVLAPWNGPLVLKRAWCLLELFAADRRGAELHVAMPPGEVDDFDAALCSDLKGISTDLSGVTLSSAACVVQADLEQMLAAAKRLAGGVHSLDQAVQRVLGRWLVKRASDMLETRPDDLGLRANVVTLLEAMGRLAEAEAECLRLMEDQERSLGPRHPDTLETINSYALLLSALGKDADAEVFIRRALQGKEATLGLEHPGTLSAVHSLGVILSARGKVEEAEGHYRRALRGKDRVLGKEHWSTLVAASSLAGTLAALGKIDEAEALYRRALAGQERALGPVHRSTLDTINNLAGLVGDLGKHTEAEGLYRRALAGRETTLGPDHPDTIMSMSNVAMLLSGLQRHEEAIAYIDRALSSSERVLGRDNASTLRALSRAGSAYLAAGHADKAEELYRRALAGQESVLGRTHHLTLSTTHHLASLLAARGGKQGEAEELYRRALAGLERHLGRDHLDTLMVVNNLAGLLSARGSHDEAAQLYRRALAGFEDKLGADHAYAKSARSGLERVLVFGAKDTADGRVSSARTSRLSGYHDPPGPRRSQGGSNFADGVAPSRVRLSIAGGTSRGR